MFVLNREGKIVTSHFGREENTVRSPKAGFILRKQEGCTGLIPLAFPKGKEHNPFPSTASGAGSDILVACRGDYSIKSM